MRAYLHRCELFPNTFKLSITPDLKHNPYRIVLCYKLVFFLLPYRNYLFNMRSPFTTYQPRLGFFDVDSVVPPKSLVKYKKRCTNPSKRYMLLAGKTELEQGGPRIMLGARVIAALPDQNTCNFLLEYYFEKCYDNRAYKRITMAICASFWNTFGNEMREPRCMEDMEKISSAIYKNITTPLEESEDWDTYVASFTGTNMRWESVGCLFAGLSSALLSLPERDGFFTTQRGSRTDRKHFAVELKDCLQACMSLSNYMDFLNIIMVAITCRNMFLQTVLSGDTSTKSFLFNSRVY